MSERYKRLFALPKHLYADGSPLLIEAGALLKDSQTGRILAQIKFKSISPKIIKAVKISIGAFDISGVKLRGIDEYQYLDLSASRDSEFGQKNAVELPESITRSFSCECKSVVFYDGTTWESKGAEWKPLAQAQTLKEKLGALCEQYRRDTVDYADLVVTDDRDLWICTCGAINKKDEKCCHSCHVNKKILTDALDVKKLEENEAALKKAEAERKAEIERQELEKKKRAEEKKRQYIKIAKKITIISLPIVCVVVAFVIILNTIIIPNINYNNAVELMEDGKYSEAVVAFEAADGYEDSANMINECKDKLIKLLRKHTLACGYNNSFGLMDNGEVKATGNNNNDQCNVDSWKNIIQLAAGGSHTVGLKSDGTVVAVGNNSFGPCEVADWSDIIQIAAGGSHTVGLKSDKTVIALGRDDCGQCNVKGWSDIVFITARDSHTVGVKSDGTVVATGDNRNGQCDVDSWTDIVQISAGNDHTVGLKTDGTVVAVGDNYYGQCDVDSWSNIIQIAAGGSHTVGLKDDGTVVAVGNNENGQCDVDSWTDIVQIAAGYDHTLGLKSDGTVVAVGGNEYGQCNVSDWKNIKLVSKE